MPRRHHPRGFTLVEVTIILTALTVLGAIMLPQMGSFNRLARYARVKEDLGAICSALKVMLDDVGENAVYGDAGPTAPPDRRDTPVGLLVGEGDIPLDPGSAGDPRHPWGLPVLETFSVPTDGGNVEPTFTVDTLGNHLISNTPLGDGDNRWRSPLEMPRGFHALFAWRGPYISDAIDPDPWGNRYMVNAFALYSPPGAGPHDRYGSGVVCISAGPDARIDTDFNQPFGWETGDDDLTALLGGGGPM